MASEPAVTVFTPVDAAFDPDRLAELQADADLLRRTVLQHVVRESLPADVLRARTSITSSADGALEVVASENGITVGGFDVESAPAEASNGLVYGINGVLDVPR